jgi:hypothetical protein
MRYKSGLQLKKTQTQLNKQTIDQINGKNRNISVNMGTEELVALQHFSLADKLLHKLLTFNYRGKSDKNINK